MIIYKSYILNIGQTLEIQCLSEGDVIWFHQTRHSIPLNETDSTLVIESVSLSDQGTYYCYGFYRVAKLKQLSFIAETEVQIHG